MKMNDLIEKIEESVVEGIDVDIEEERIIISFYKKTKEEEEKIKNSIHQIINECLNAGWELGNFKILIAKENNIVKKSKYIFLKKEAK